MYICAIFLAIEFLIFILIYVRRKAFMPTAEEIQEAMKKVSGPTVKTVSECPNCREIIEKDWASCPQCGTRLPRHCANCGFELLTKTEKCPNCGVTVEKAETVQKQIGTLKKISEEEARPEAMSVRYARLAEAYLKAGEVDQALDNYKEAIHFTAFDRKRSNFMVKMATIMHNSGRNDEAIQILDAAMQLDPSDAAGAALTKNRIAAHGLVQAAQAALDKGNESEALRLADEALKTDMTDYYRAAGLRGMITARELVRKAEEAIASMNQEAAAKLLDDAIRLDPTGRTNARTLRDQVEVQRGSKVKK
jgi:tetratricopeptide (TPR) repeat protein